MKESFAYKLGILLGKIANLKDDVLLPWWRNIWNDRDCSREGLFRGAIEAFKNESLEELEECLKLLKSWYPDYPETVETEKLHLNLKKELLKREKQREKEKEMAAQRFDKRRSNSLKLLKVVEDNFFNIHYCYNPFFEHPDDSNLLSLYIKIQNVEVNKNNLDIKKLWPFRIKISCSGDSVISVKKIYLSDTYKSIYSITWSPEDVTIGHLNGHEYLSIDTIVPLDLLEYLNKVVRHGGLTIRIGGSEEITRMVSREESNGLKIVLNACNSILDNEQFEILNKAFYLL